MNMIYEIIKFYYYYLGKSETNSVVTLPVLLYKILPLCRIFLISLDAQLLEFLCV